MKKKKAFTLIELLVVVAIMGLLAALAVIALNQARQRARDVRRLADVKQIQTALELYYLDQNAYPATNDILGGECLDAGGWKEAAACTATPVYMGLVPTNPSPFVEDNCGVGVGLPYSYTAKDSNQSYNIYYCIAGETGGILAGWHHATPAGLANP